MKEIITLFFIIVTILYLYRYWARSKRNPNFSYSKLIADFFTLTPNPIIKELLNINPYGIVFGQKGLNFVCRDELQDGHILIVGGSGSGKSSCVIIPTLKSWRSRVFAIDIKGELKSKTAQDRKHIKYFDPNDANAWGYDPFYLARKTENIIEAVGDIAIALIPLLPSVPDPFWVQTSQGLLKAFLLYFINIGLTFPETIDAILSTPIKELIQEVSASSNNDAKRAITPFVELEQKVLTGVYMEMVNKISIFAEDYSLKSALEKENLLTPEDLENGYDVYIVVAESQLDRWGSFLTLIISQFLKSFERRQDSINNMPILFVLDEFPRLGKVSPIINGLGTLRSKKITMCLVIQSLAQIEFTYGEVTRKVIADNCTYKAVLLCSDPESQKYFSDLIGYRKVERKTYSTGRGDGFLKRTTESVTLVDEPIIRPETLAYIEKILLITPYKYTWVEKTPYYSHPAFTKKEI